MNKDRIPEALGLIALAALCITAVGIEVVKFLAYWAVAFS